MVSDFLVIRETFLPSKRALIWALVSDCQRFRSEPIGGSTRWFIFFVGGDLELRTRWLCNGAQNKRNTVSLYWFMPLESKTLCLGLDCIPLDGCDLSLGGHPCPSYIG
jgi:hypothetical protein